MYCPECGEKSTVTDTGADKKEVIRRRKCKSCGHRFVTIETYVSNEMLSISKLNYIRYTGGQLNDY